jgi:hypothetical protein
LPYLILVLILHPLCRKAYDSFWRTATYTNVRPNTGQRADGLSQGLPANAAASVRQEQRLSFDFYFALIFIAALHGFSALKVLLILYINFKLVKTVSPQYLTAVTWLFNISILFANEFGRGYSYASIAMFLSPPLGAEKTGTTWGHWMDDHGGLISRWEVLFNITVLRLISFNLDYTWSLQKRGGNAIEVCAHLEVALTYAQKLTAQRRSNSIQQICQRTIASGHQPNLRTIPSATTWLMRCTRRSTWLVQSSHLTTTSRNAATKPRLLPQIVQSVTPFDSPSLCFAWK